ncbi:MAG: hypothetical protein PSX80_01030, partial [bacterium]|nr:hypothetical protein [bacterium]
MLQKALSNLHLLAILLAVFSFGCSSEPASPSFVTVRTPGATNDQFGEPFGIATVSGKIYLTDGERNEISTLQPDGTTALLADSEVDTPSAIAFDPNGDLVVANTGANTIVKFDSTGTPAVVAGRPKL